MNTSAHPTQPFVLLDEGLIANTPDHDIAVLDLDALTEELTEELPDPSVLLEYLETILDASTDPDDSRRMDTVINNLLSTPKMSRDIVTQLAEVINDSTTMSDEVRAEAVTMLENTDRERYASARAVLTGMHEPVGEPVGESKAGTSMRIKDGAIHTLFISHGTAPVFIHTISRKTMVTVHTYESTEPASVPPRDSVDLWMHQLMINLDSPEPFGATHPRTNSQTVVMDP